MNESPREHFAECLRRRTKAFAFEVLELCRRLPKTEEAKVVGRQLLRAGMSVGANYRAISRARSRAEFIPKINVVIEEADETLFWLEAVSEKGIVSAPETDALLREGNELLRILVVSQRTAKKTQGRSS
ncbi:MAG TPA: four helix bundle protein [Thermoanaerobaculia bacterium]|nr:four helix bundle protein [Thermoanaerobaculia bacterium]